MVPIGKFSKRKRDALHCRVGSLAGFEPQSPNGRIDHLCVTLSARVPMVLPSVGSMGYESLMGKYSKHKRDALHCLVGSLAGFEPPPLSLSQSAAERGGNN